MKRFQDLAKKKRDLIVIGSWVLLLIISSIIQASIEGVSENMSSTQSIIMGLSFIAAIVLTIFAVKANRNDKRLKELAEEQRKEEERARIQKIKEEAAYQEAVEAVSKKASIALPIHTKIKGVSYYNRQECLSESKAGDPLSIVHTPSSNYPDAVTVTNHRTEKELGYINSLLAKDLILYYGRECSFVGYIEEITGGGHYFYGCNIVISEFEA